MARESVSGFVGRRTELALLDDELKRARETGRGRLLVMRGRRQVGKSRLLTEWLERIGAPSAFFTASRRPPAREVELFAQELAASALPSAPSFAAARPADWDDALALLAATQTGAEPVVIVLDEFPYLVRGDASIEATIQKLWDRRLCKLPLLLILVGSDLGMMESLAGYDRPLYGRLSREVVVDPLGPADVAQLLELDAAEAIDAYLVVGGFPGVVTSWPPGLGLRQFVEFALAEATSPLVVMGERSLAAEFPPDAHARRVLEVIGSGRRTFRAIADRVGISDASLAQALQLLTAKRVVAAEDPLSARRSGRLRRYRVADPYLRFWLRFVGLRIDDIQRGRPDLAIRRLWSAWDAYRGLAVEPLVRGAVEMLLPDGRFGDAQRVGGWWNRSHDAEVDLVGVAEQPRRVEFVGSIKWRDRAAFDDADAGELASGATLVPGADTHTRHVGVARAGFATARLDVALGPEELIGALG